jgi:hypothetical protein
VDGIRNIVEAQKKAALNYFEDGGVDMAIPPLKALLHIMAQGEYEGKTLADPEVRKLFDLQALLDSDWYQERLEAKLTLEKKTLKKKADYLKAILDRNHIDSKESREIREKLEGVNARRKDLDEHPDAYLAKLKGTLGCDPSLV